jgi:hypothetical protein
MPSQRFEQHSLASVHSVPSTPQVASPEQAPLAQPSEQQSAATAQSAPSAPHESEPTQACPFAVASQRPLQHSAPTAQLSPFDVQGPAPAAPAVPPEPVDPLEPPFPEPDVPALPLVADEPPVPSPPSPLPAVPPLPFISTFSLELQLTAKAPASPKAMVTRVLIRMVSFSCDLSRGPPPNQRNRSRSFRASSMFCPFGKRSAYCSRSCLARSSRPCSSSRRPAA